MPRKFRVCPVIHKQQRNLVPNKIKQAKMQYYKDKFNNNLHDVKSTWNVINKILKPSSKRQNDFQIKNDDTKLRDSTEIANAFNDYFSSVAPSLAAQIPDVGIDPISYLSRNPNSFVYFDVDTAEVKKQILSFKIVNSLIENFLSPVLSKLINQSFEKGISPTCLKTARVIPVNVFTMLMKLHSLAKTTI